MRSRTQGMWWGPALEAPDPAALARFYSDLIGWPVVYEEPGTTVLATSRDAAVNVVFQQADRLPAAGVAAGGRRSSAR